MDSGNRLRLLSTYQEPAHPSGSRAWELRCPEEVSPGRSASVSPPAGAHGRDSELRGRDSEMPSQLCPALWLLRVLITAHAEW